MSNDLPNIPENEENGLMENVSENASEPDEEKAPDSKKVSYKKTREAVKSKYSPRHFSDAEAEKTYKQMRLEKVRIRIRKIKRLNLGLTILTIVLLFAMFLGAGILIPRTITDVNAEEYKNKSLTVDFVGDVMFGRYINQYAQSNGYDSIFEDVAPFFKNSDLTFANLECAVLKDPVSTYTKADKKIHLHCNYNLIEAAQRSGINVFGASNNHGFDYGNRPVEELIEYFRKNDVYYNGIGTDIVDAAKYTLIDCKGYRIAFVAITDVYYKEACASVDRSGVLATTYGDYNQLVNDASRNADITIVYFHWGEENDISRNKEQTNLGHKLIDAGADIIIGSHPHVLQEVEKYKDGIIFYSMGNFIFDQGTTFSRDSVIVEMNLDKHGEAEFTLVPIRINDGIPEVTKNFFYKTRINRELTQSLGKEDQYTGDDGYTHVKLGRSFTRTAAQRATEATASTDATGATSPTGATVTAESAAPTQPTAQKPSETAAINETKKATQAP